MLPSSTSDPVAEQLRVVPTTTFELGLTVVEVMVGEVLLTVTVVEEVAEPPSESVAVAVQVTMDPTLVSEAVTV